MSLKTQFTDEPFFAKLRHRAYGFMKIIEHVEGLSRQFSTFTILETGCCRIKDNWWGDGQSTRIWDWVAQKVPGVRAMSIDITLEFIEMSKEMTTKVEYIHSDSIKALNNLDSDTLGRVGLLYLDSYDWSEEIALDSAFHHLAELTSVWRYLPPGCMIVVDDRHDTFKGKHTMVQMFMEKLGIEPVFAEYQIAWIKP